MWDTHSVWFDVALILGIFAFGNIQFGHFEEYRPKWRRHLKVVFVVSVAILLFYVGLRWVTYVALLLLLGAASYIHAVWLPQNGVNGWTGEPKRKYYELLGIKPPPQDSE